MPLDAAVTTNVAIPPMKALPQPTLSTRTARRHWIVVLALLCFGASQVQDVRAADVPNPPTSPSPTLATDTLPAGVQLDGAATSEEPTLVSRWWFWTAVGAVAIATAAIIVASSRGSAPPSTTLGNRTFQP